MEVRENWKTLRIHFVSISRLENFKDPEGAKLIYIVYYQPEASVLLLKVPENCGSSLPRREILNCEVGAQEHNLEIAANRPSRTG